MFFGPAVYPSNCQFQAHFGEFLTYGYKPTESVSVKFHNDRGDRVLGRFETGFVDGQTKCLLMLSIVAFCAELNFSELELQNANLQKVLSSFGSIRCSYEHYSSQSQYFLQSLRSSTTIYKFGFLSPHKISMFTIYILNYRSMCYQPRTGLRDSREADSLADYASSRYQSGHPS